MKKIGIFLLLPISSGVFYVFSCYSVVLIWKQLSGLTGFGRIAYIFTALSSQIFWFELYPSRCTIPRGVSFYSRPSAPLRINSGGNLIIMNPELYYPLLIMLKINSGDYLILIQSGSFFLLRCKSPNRSTGIFMVFIREIF